MGLKASKPNTSKAHARGHGQKQVGVVPEVAAEGRYANAVRGTLHTGNGNMSPLGDISCPNMELKFIKPTCVNGRVKVQQPEGVAVAGPIRLRSGKEMYRFDYFQG
ncbi:hypothetical protein CJ030_MR7G025645 [Morella rubra]|uniref:Uncharacterized protein n=1 Tax=Morella rubra TaxID=262757 RepID=A0A6A1V185_9ROSI|nr:hypothetical protein CJ030_MR7G025645 [Morella rubra]